MTPSIEDLHPAQNRGFRELYAAARLVVTHYRRLATSIDEDALHEGAAAARRLLDELATETSRYDLHGYPAAQGVGGVSARGWSRVATRFLERNQALRLAVLDVQHVVTLLAYLANVCDANGNAELAAFCRRWHEEMSRVEDHVRAAAAQMGTRPGEAVEPLDSGLAGRAGHSVQQAVGAFGEWFDRSAARRRG